MHASHRLTPLALALAMGASPTLAEDTAAKISAPVVVTATRVEQNAFDIPAAIDSIDTATLQSQRATVNISETLNRVPGTVAAGKENYAQEQSLTIRGFGARSQFGVRGIKLLADGIPASTPDGQGGTGLFDLASAQRIEVLRGPFSALYGNHSGGVVQVFTEDGPARFTVTPSVQGGSYDSWKYGVKFGDTVGNINYLASLSRFDTDGYRDWANSRRDQYNLKAKLQLAEKTTLTIVGNRMFQPDNRDPLGLTLDQMRQDRRQQGVVDVANNLTAKDFGTRRNLENNQGGLVFETALSSRDSLRAMVYMGDRSNEQYLGITAAVQNNIRGAGAVSTFDRDFWGTGIRWTHKFDTATLTMGGDVERADEDRRGYRSGITTASTVAAIGSYGVRGDLKRNERNVAEQKGVYAQLEWALARDFTLSGGTRYTRVKFESKDKFICTLAQITAPGTAANRCSGSTTNITGTAFNPDDSGKTDFSDWTPVLGALWKFSPTTNFYANAGKSFEAPTLIELAYRPDGNNGLNLDLKPSRSMQYEIGMKSFLTDSTRFDAALFYINTRDEIVTARNFSGRVAYQNASDTSRRGLELALDSRLTDSLGLYMSATLLRARFDDSYRTCLVAGCTDPNSGSASTVNAGNRLAGVANRSFYGELTWKHAPLGFSGALEWRASGSVYANDTNDDRVGGYSVASIRGGFQQRTAQGWRFNEFLRVDNLFDKEYVGSVYINDANQRYYAPASERTWLIGLSAAYAL